MRTRQRSLSPGSAPKRRLSRALSALALAVLAAASGVTAAPASVPPPSATSSVVTVRTGGDRTGDASVGPLAGVRLALYASADATTPVGQPWATCVSDAQGDCSFTVPDTGAGGANEGATFVVGQPEDGAPAGWYTNTTLRTGPGSGSGSFSSPYRFTTPALAAQRTYRSTSDFMFGTAYGTSPYLASSGIWQQSRTNPGLPESCGLDVAVVLDLSASVGSALPALKRAADTFTNALTGTPSRLSLFSFDGDSPSTGTANHPEHISVSTKAGADSFKALYADWQLGKGTNWDQGLYTVAKARQKYDAVVVLTDGNPTYWNKPREGGGSNTAFADVEGGIFAANAVKAKGTRVVAVGVGKGVEGVSGRNLRAISGTEAFDGSNPTTADYYQTDDFAGAGQALTDLALTHCDGSLTVVKQLVPKGNTGEDVSGATNAGPGWQFDASTTTPGITGLPASQSTSDDGTGAVVFQPGYPSTAPTADVGVTEIQQPGHALVTQDGKNAVCTDLDDGTEVPVTNSGSTTGPGFTVDVPRLTAISCVVYNKPERAAADVRVDKDWTIDGVAYRHADRPRGFDAGLTLTGPGAAGAGAQPWGTARPGYEEGERATVAETVKLPRDCVLDRARVVRANGQALDGRLPYRAALAAGHNRYTVRNVVTCSGRLTLRKTVANHHGGTAAPGDWTLTASGPDTVAGVSGSPEVTSVRVPAGDYTLGEKNGPAGYTASAWDCAGESGPLPTADGQVTVAARSAVTCVLTNRDREPAPSPTPTPGPSRPPHPAPGHGSLGATGSDGFPLWLPLAAAGSLTAGAALLWYRRSRRLM